MKRMEEGIGSIMIFSSTKCPDVAKCRF